MSQRWLSHYAGHWLHFSCPRCGLKKSYDADRTLAQMGNHNLAGMCVVLAEALKCPRVFSLSSWDICRMDVRPIKKPSGDPVARALHNAKIAKGGLHTITTMRLDELQEWHVLYATCTCGRSKALDRSKMAKKYPGLTADEVAKKLSCRHCGKAGTRYFAIANMPR